jgi:hypothetical protein
LTFSKVIAGDTDGAAIGGVATLPLVIGSYLFSM